MHKIIQQPSEGENGIEEIRMHRRWKDAFIFIPPTSTLFRCFYSNNFLQSVLLVQL